MNLHITWERFHTDCLTLAHLITFEKREFDDIVCVTRGGLVPTATISRELNIQVIETVGISSYDECTQRGLEVHKHVKSSLVRRLGMGTLVVDDLVDTGKTLALVRELLPLAYFAAVYAKPAGLKQVDIYTHRIPQDTWIIFPWEFKKLPKFDQGRH